MRRSTVIITLVILGGVALSLTTCRSCQRSRWSNWPTYNYGNNNSGYGAAAQPAYDAEGNPIPPGGNGDGTSTTNYPGTSYGGWGHGWGSSWGRSGWGGGGWGSSPSPSTWGSSTGYSGSSGTKSVGGSSSSSGKSVGSSSSSGVSRGGFGGSGHAASSSGS